jgi:transposase-like protein
MVIEILLCRHCQSQNVIKHGRDKRGVQRFRCHDCRRTFHKPEDDRSYTADFRAQVLAAYQERASMRGVCREVNPSVHTRVRNGCWLT